MSKILTASTAAVASLALGAGVAATATAPAQATTCHTVSVYCSMAHAKLTNTSARYGTSGYAVRELQRALRYVGGTGASITGTFDAQTRAALKRYQYSRSLSQTGVLNGRTLAFLRAGAGATRSTSSTTQVSSNTGVSTAAARAVAYAYAHLGRPYVYGATGPNSFDCSGLTYAAYRAAGKSIPRTSYAQLAGLKRVSLSSLRPGDIIGYYSGGHVAIYIGNGTVIHAPHTGTVVKKAALRSMPITWAVRPA